MQTERGFVLVVSLVLLAVLTGLVGMGAYKVMVEQKVAKLSADASIALSAAEAGLQRQFTEWATDTSTGSNDGDQAELGVIAMDIRDGTNNANVYIPNLTSDASSTVTDDVVRETAGIRVYALGSASMDVIANSQWGVGTQPQVAVWATRYLPAPAGDVHPYDNMAYTNGVACENCTMVVYALGRAGDARRMLRETQLEIRQDMRANSALNNAPSYGSWQEMCDAADPKIDLGVDYNWSAPPGSAETLVEVTQVSYVTGTSPSGMALASNTHMGVGAKNFRDGTESTTGASFDATPLIAYAGHASTQSMKVDYANVTQDVTPSPDAPDLPANLLPRALVSDALINTNGEMRTFSDSDPNAHLFEIDAYRWAAEQFTCPDGIYCTDHADTLRQAIPGAIKPVTGRLTLAEFQYNIANSIPMFGLVRVLYPASPDDTEGPCVALGGNTVTLYQADDEDGDLGANAKLIVYGSLLIDFFSDDNGNAVFDSGENVLTPFQATDVYAKMSFPVMINPVAPAGTLGVFPTAAGGVIAAGSAGNTVNLASPVDGYFPATEGLPAVSSNASDGSMRLMHYTNTPNLMSVARSMEAGASVSTAADALFQTHKDALQYYHNLSVAATDTAEINHYPVTGFPASMSDAFAMGVLDYAAGNNDGDKFHLLFPSGYQHGWKVALAALNITAAEWNAMGNTYPDYFYVTPDPVTGYGLLDKDWRDVPAMMYAGGLLDMHMHNNISGVVYTPSSLEWETGNAQMGALGYINGTIFSGFGAYVKNNGQAHSILVYDSHAFDHMTAKTRYFVLRQSARQEVL